MNKDYFNGLIFGMITGAAALFLSDPKNRKKLAKTFSDLEDKAGDIKDEGQEKVQDLKQKSLEKVSEELSKAQQKIKKEQDKK